MCTTYVLYLRYAKGTEVNSNILYFYYLFKSTIFLLANVVNGKKTEERG